MYKITNTAEDRRKSNLHRMAAKFELEPTIGGATVRLRSSIIISDAIYERQIDTINSLIKKGIIEVSKIVDFTKKEEKSPSKEVQRQDPEESSSVLDEVVEEESSSQPQIVLPPPSPPMPLPKPSLDDSRKGQNKKLFR